MGGALNRCLGCFLEPATTTACVRCGYHDDPGRFPTALQPGTKLSKYTLGRVLGRPGGFGTTYLSFDPVLNRRVALKELMPRDLVARRPDGATLHVHTREDETLFQHTLAAFLDEARLTAQFNHPNLVRVLDFFEGNGTAYFAMEYYQGQTLAEYTRQNGGRLPGTEAVSLTLTLLDAPVVRRVWLRGDVYFLVTGRVLPEANGSTIRGSSRRRPSCPDCHAR